MKKGGELRRRAIRCEARNVRRRRWGGSTVGHTLTSSWGNLPQVILRPPGQPVRPSRHGRSDVCTRSAVPSPPETRSRSARCAGWIFGEQQQRTWDRVLQCSVNGFRRLRCIDHRREERPCWASEATARQRAAATLPHVSSLLFLLPRHSPSTNTTWTPLRGQCISPWVSRLRWPKAPADCVPNLLRGKLTRRTAPILSPRKT